MGKGSGRLAGPLGEPEEHEDEDHEQEHGEIEPRGEGHEEMIPGFFRLRSGVGTRWSRPIFQAGGSRM